MGLPIGFAMGFICGVLSELPLSNVIRIFSDSGDSTGLLFFKILMFGFIGMVVGGVLGLFIPVKISND